MMFPNNQSCFTSFIQGYMCAAISDRQTEAKVSEAELDNVKRLAEKCVEMQIDYSALSEEEKKSQKDKHKLWSELALAGMKKRLRERERLM